MCRSAVLLTAVLVVRRRRYQQGRRLRAAFNRSSTILWPDTF